MSQLLSAEGEGRRCGDGGTRGRGEMSRGERRGGTRVKMDGPPLRVTEMEGAWGKTHLMFGKVDQRDFATGSQP